MPVSQDFRDSMRLLQMEMQKLQRENAELRKEFDALKKDVENSDEINVRKKDEVVKRAALSNDTGKIKALSTDANSVLQDEILRQAMPMVRPSSIEVTQIRGDLVDNYINAFMAGEIERFPFTVSDKPKQQNIDKNERMSAQLRNNTQRMLQESKMQQDLREQRKTRYLKDHKEKSNALTKLSPLWRTELDEESSS